MRRRRLIGWLAGLAVLLAVGAVLLWPRTYRITRENYERFVEEKGESGDESWTVPTKALTESSRVTPANYRRALQAKTRDEVEAILGPGATSHHVAPSVPGETVLEWENSYGYQILVWFDLSGKKIDNAEVLP
jgi:hypothetical protein